MLVSRIFRPCLETAACQVMQGVEGLITSCTEHGLWRLEPAHKGHVQISVDVCHFDKFMVESSSIGRYEEKSIQ